MPEQTKRNSSKQSEITLVIPTYKTRELLRGCLKSIISNPPSIPNKIVVIDDASNDGSVEMVRNEFPQVRLLINQENQGYTKSMNRGLREVEGQFFVLMNSDIEIQDGTFDILIDFLQNNPDAAIAGPQLLNPDGSLQYSCRLFPSLTFSCLSSFLPARLTRRFKSCKQYFCLEMDYTKVNSVDMASATCTIARSSLLNQIGFMNEKYFMFIGDTEWFYRVKMAGWKTYYVPEAKVVHFGSQSMSTTNRKLLKDYHWGMLRFFKDYIGKGPAVSLWPAVIIGVSLRYLIKRAEITFSKRRNFTNIDIRPIWSKQNK